jgi:hypothetical protein
MNVTPLRPTEPYINPELVAMVEYLLTRVKAGVTIGLAVVEHQIGDVVVVETDNNPDSYYQITAGTAKLANMLANDGWS